MKAIVLIGHDDITGLDEARFKAELEKAILSGAEIFYSGGQGGFDRLGARLIYEWKKTYPHIQNILVIPYLTFRIFEPSLFDEIIYPAELERYHFKAAIGKRNQYMVSRAQGAICYHRYSWGRSTKAYEFAKATGLWICNLAE